jgi:hypothetical protein
MNYYTTGHNKRGLILQARDLLLLSELARVSLADREQIKVLARFNSTTRANLRLLALVRAGFLYRRFSSASATARKAVYSLSQKGAELTAGRTGTRRWRKIPLEMFCEHELRITDFYIALRQGVKNNPRIRVDTWRVCSASVSQSILVVPDGYFQIREDAAALDCFLEMDMGTEALGVWVSKVEQYLALAKSGEYGAHFPSKQFRVLVVAPSERRLQNLRAATASVTTKIFWFATQKIINSEGVLSPIWSRPEGNARLPLL